MTEAPPNVTFQSQHLFHHGWSFTLLQRLVFYFQIFISGLVYREMWEMKLLGLTFLNILPTYLGIHFVCCTHYVGNPQSLFYIKCEF